MSLGPWDDRVRFTPEGTAYVPGEIAIDARPEGVGPDAWPEEVDPTAESVAEPGSEETERILAAARDLLGAAVIGDEENLAGYWYRFRVTNAEEAVRTLNEEGFTAQVIHVFFSHAVHGNPFYASPFYASQVSGNPFYASPFYASPFYASPAALPQIRPTGVRPSSARPATPTGRTAPKVSKEYRPPHVAILDTGWIPNAHTRLAGMNEPHVVDMSTVLSAQSKVIDRQDEPDGNGDGYLDPVTGHATFIAGIIESYAPGTRITIMPVLSEYGDGNEGDITMALSLLLDEDRRPDVVNLSFGGYLFESPGGPGLAGFGPLRSVISRLRRMGTVVVASAGNDGTFAPTYPAAFPGVVGVAAVDAHGQAAPFTNYGNWVRACALGVDVVSLFFDDFPISDNRFYGVDPKQYEGWATWSGTSFAAPRVVAAIARALAETPQVDATKLAVDMLGPPNAADKLPLLGTLVGFD
jgi:hypothetical protein